MDPAVFKPWLDLLVSHGAPLAITGIVLWLAIKYVPKFIDGSLDSQSKVPGALQEMATNIKELAMAFRDGKSDLDQIKADLKELTKAIREHKQ